MATVIQFVTLLGMALKFKDVFKLHFAGLAVVKDHHNLPVLLLLLQGLLLVD